jgi:hypothetical protein
METDVAGAFKGPPPSPASRQLSRRGFDLIAKCPATVPPGVPLQDSAKMAEFNKFSEGVPQTVPLSCLDGAVGVPPVPLSLEAGQRDSTGERDKPKG